MVAIALGLVALWQRGTAVEQRDTAQSRELTARSVAQLSIDPAESVALAREAIEKRPTAESEEALGEALIRSHVTAVLPTGGGRLAGLSPDGRTVLAASSDGALGLWRPAEDAFAPAVSLEGPGAPVAAAALSADGSRVAAASEDGARVWRTDSGEAVRTIPSASPVRQVALGGDGGSLLTLAGDGRARLWDARHGDGAPAAMPAGGAQRAELSAEGGVVLTWGGGPAVVWDGRAGRRLRTLGGDEVTAAGLSPDGSLAATGGADGTARVWAALGGGPSVPLTGHRGQVTAAAFAAGGGRVVTAGIDGTARVWDARTGAAVQVLNPHAGPIAAIAVTADGRRVVTAGDDGVARVWDARTGAPRAVLAGTGGNILAVAVERAMGGSSRPRDTTASSVHGTPVAAQARPRWRVNCFIKNAQTATLISDSR